MLNLAVARLLTACVLAGLLVCATPAMADVLATEWNLPEHISAARGMVLWSESDPGADTYRLRLYAHGATRTLHVAPRPVPFDAQLATDSAGRVVAVYSRCRKDIKAPSNSEGCDLFRFDIRTGKERRFGRPISSRWSEMSPTLDGSRIAFVRVNDGAAVPDPKVLEYDMRTGKLLRLSGPVRGVVALFDDGYYIGPRVLALDVRAGRVALGWSHLDDACTDYFGEYIDIDELWLFGRDGKAHRVAGGGCGTSESSFWSLSATPSSLLYVDEELDARGYSRLNLKRLDFRTGETSVERPLQFGYATDGEENLVVGARENQQGFYEIVREPLQSR